MMRVRTSNGFVAVTLVGALIAGAGAAFGQPSDQEDHPALSLADPAPVTEDHPALPLLAPSLAVLPAPAASPAAPPTSTLQDKQTQEGKVTAGISFLNPTITTDPSPGGVTIPGAGILAPDGQPATPAVVNPAAPPGATLPTQTAGPGTADPSKTAEAPPPDPVTLTHPAVADTAKLTGDNKTILLFGIVGLSGSFADNLHGAIASDGDKVTCQAQTANEYMCLLADGVDVAALALRNGAAQTRADSPDTYHDLETVARDERRGIWASLPPPPVHVQHPTVVTTSTLTANGQTYQLDGVQGLGGQYARDFQGYILANGDSLMCNPQGDAGHYVCLLPDGTDMAKAALVNGAARVAADAPDSYRVEQGDALANKRGYWKNPPEDVLMAATSTTSVTQSAYTIVSGDNGSDGVTYVGGAPATIIDGQTVFIGYGGDNLGWGYWDRYHHWARAPGRMVEHMNRYHPGGQGLRGYGGVHEAAFHGGGMGGHPGGNFVRPAPATFHPAGGGGFHGAPAGGGGGRHR